MGAAARDPFEDDEIVPPQAAQPALRPAFVLHSQEALKEMQELLELVQYWRVRYEKLADEKELRLKRWRRQHGR